MKKFIFITVVAVIGLIACNKTEIENLLPTQKSIAESFNDKPWTYLQNKYLDLVLAYELKKIEEEYNPEEFSYEKKIEIILHLDSIMGDETKEDVYFYENLEIALMAEINSHPYIQEFIGNFALKENDANDMIIYTGYSDCYDAISKFEILKYYEEDVDVIAHYSKRNNLTGDEEWNPFPIESSGQKAVRYKLHLTWGKTVEYMWNGVNSTVKTRTISAMADWRAAANNKITFSEITKNVNWNKFLWCIGCKYFIRISQHSNNNGSSWSSMGKVPYAHINYSTGASYPRNYRHELGHNLGLDHEHQRPDRDNYIKYHSSNVTSGNGKYFSKMTADSYNYYGSTFDFESIMLYDSHAFAKNGYNGIPADATLTKKDGITIWDAPANISETDKNVIRQMYP